MSSEPQSPSERDIHLRQVLVATATASTTDTPRRGRTVVGSIVAFALAGAVTGGAISAAALTRTAEPEPTSISVVEMTEGIVRDDTELFGTPFVISSFGETEIDLGPAPAGASSLILALHCLDPGTYQEVVDGTQIGAVTCTERDADFTNGGGVIPITVEDDSEDHTLQIVADASQRYVIWASWATPALKAEASEAQQAALADGVVTEAEYRDGFARYAACMTDAGHPLLRIDESGTIIDYSNTAEAVNSGKDQRCYDSEFANLDVAWQLDQEANAE
ncbi:hypothetical protein GCM10009819_12760 [Agromyces tropicus]|uniref:Serine/threonine protein kinase n=1 Tax=Agromyces tropicus TaxID=555371 RepID=A0ABP5FS70_9MICO